MQILGSSNVMIQPK